MPNEEEYKKLKLASHTVNFLRRYAISSDFTAHKMGIPKKQKTIFKLQSFVASRNLFFFSPLSAFFKWHRLLPRDMFTKLAITIISIACWRLNRSRKSSSLSICDAQNTQMKWKNIAWNTFR